MEKEKLKSILNELKQELDKCDKFQDTDVFNTLPQTKREAFINKTEELANVINHLENKISQGLLDNLELNEEELKKGIRDLKEATQKIEQIPAILKTATSIINTITKIISILT